jgi:hypothetical protein
MEMSTKADVTSMLAWASVLSPETRDYAVAGR